ncbi:MAG TPA: ATP-binding domain-containing protein [Myxococcota bacterium]|nr:ATP-binding domain-containing protein [Myxococcota bacterium]
MNPVVQEEMGCLDEVLAAMQRVPPPESLDETGLLAELERLREDARTAKNEDKAAIEQHYEHMGRLLEQLRKGRPTEAVDPESPYFAHLRIRQGSRETDIFLGKATRLGDGLRIVDWRHAPIAKVYYQYEEGEEYEEDLGHKTLTGQVLARRTVSIRERELERVSAPQGTWVREGDTWTELATLKPARMDATGVFLWHRAAGDQKLGTGKAHRSDKHLPDIAALIDKEQFELISRPDAGPVILRGGAGSGKTTVALHRIAWLAHQNPTRFAPHRMQVVVWGRALRDYVSKVLPNLGVANVSVTTWSEWSRRLVGRLFPMLPGHANANTPAMVARFKLHPALPLKLEKLIRSRKVQANPSAVLEDWRLLTSDRSIMEELGFTPAETEQIAEHARAQQTQLDRRLEREKGAEPWLDEEDDAILLRCWQLRLGALKAKGGGELRYSHIAVDEAQDFAAMELAVLMGTLDKYRCITLAGDTQQHILEVGGTGDWSTLLDSLGIPSTSLSSLRISYRSTRPITAYARAILGKAAEDDQAPLTTRDGPPVEILPFPDHGACVDFLGRALRPLLGREPNASIAIITPTMELARTYFRGLERMELARLRLVEDQTYSFTPGIDVVDVSQVKGLEFDYVVVVEASEEHYPDRPHLRRLLHVAASRAIHQLWFTTVGDPSPLLPREIKP